MEEYIIRKIGGNKGIEDLIERTMEDYEKNEPTYFTPLSFDVFTQPYEDYVSEFNEKRDQFGRFDLENETEYYQEIKETAEYLYKDIDHKNPPPKEWIKEQEDRAVLFKGNPKIIYETSTLIFEFLEKQKVRTNKKKAGQKAIPKLSAEQYLLVSKDDKQRFLDRLKDKFKDEGKKEFCYLLIGLNELNLLNTESQKNVFEVITEYFGGGYGTYTNFNSHWTNPNNSDLLESTKKQIEDIKRINIIM